MQQNGNFFVCYSGGKVTALFTDGGDAFDWQEQRSIKNAHELMRGTGKAVSPWSQYIEYVPCEIKYGDRLPIPPELFKRMNKGKETLVRKFGPPGLESFRKVLDELANGVERPDGLSAMLERAAEARRKYERGPDAAYVSQDDAQKHLQSRIAESKKLQFQSLCPGVAQAIVGICEMQADMGGAVDVKPIIEAVLTAVYEFGAGD